MTEENAKILQRINAYADKKVSGIKRHAIVDSQGLPHGLLVTTANCTDRQGALDVISQLRRRKL